MSGQADSASLTGVAGRQVGQGTQQDRQQGAHIGWYSLAQPVAYRHLPGLAAAPSSPEYSLVPPQSPHLVHQAPHDLPHAAALGCGVARPARPQRVGSGALHGDWRRVTEALHMHLGAPLRKMGSGGHVWMLELGQSQGEGGG